MNFTKKDEALSNLLLMYRSGELILSPNFQRKFVWDKKQASRLIESVLMSIPLPAIYLHSSDCDRDKLFREVVDGKQRLTTLLYYMSGLCPWGSSREFRLLSQYKDLNGKSFKELDKAYMMKLKNACVRTIEMASGLEQEQKYVLFERINTGSVPLNSQEIRNCVSRGSLNNFLNSYAEEAVMEKIFPTHKEANARMIRQEVLLCILVMLHNTTRKVVTKTELDAFMIKNRDASEVEIKGYRTLLGDTMRKVLTVFGVHGFCGTATTMDVRSLLVASRWLHENRDIVFQPGVSDSIRAAFKMAKEDPDFIDPSAKVKANLIYVYLDTVSHNSVKLDPKRIFPRDLARKMYHASPDKKCALCESEILSFAEVELDHVIPWIKGGRTTEENAQLSHGICNRKKGAQQYA